MKPMKPTSKIIDHITRCMHEFRVPDEVFFWDSDRVTEEVKNLAVRKGLTISGAESMTGGMIASFLTRHPGSSDYFRGAAVVYQVDTKSKILGVSPELIKEKGVVSEDVALAMANGAKKLFGSDIAYGITGYAGPARGDEDREIGTTCVSFVLPNEKITWTAVFDGDRDEVRYLGTLLVVYCLYIIVLRA